MYSYKRLYLHDRVKTQSVPRRRFFIICAFFLAFTFALLLWKHQRGLHTPLPDNGFIGAAGSVPGVIYNAEDKWSPPPNWDPVNAVWENFTRNEDGYASTIDSLVEDNGASRKPYHPYPNYGSNEYKEKFIGSHIPCFGPRGRRLNESLDDMVYGYSGRSNGFPSPSLGCSSMVGFDDNVCFDRYGRFGAYGLDIKAQSTTLASSRPSVIDWETVDWASLQQQCVAENNNRYDMTPRPIPGDPNYERFPLESDRYDPLRKKRTAVLFRSYDGFKYTSDIIRTMRSVITELVLQSGGEYEVFLLVQVKDKNIPIFDDLEKYERIKQESVPKEFWNMTILWNEGLWEKLYPKLPDKARDVFVSQWLPVQWFAQSHPNFDFYWNWEMDVRFTGHHYQLTEQLGAWAKQQPRKGLWERNSRFYVPGFHGDFSSQFTDFVQAKYEFRTRSGEVKADTTIWGPHVPSGQAPAPFDDQPPLTSPTPAHDNFNWGVGEEADLITLLPMFNPDTTHYVLRSAYFNYPKKLDPAGPPRRAAIITFYRLSHRLLSTMHLENIHDPGHHMTSEVWPQSVALHHGFKAVYAPHSIYMDRKWPAVALDFIFNNGDSQRVIKEFKDVPPEGEGSGGWESVFGNERQHNFIPSTWYYRTIFATRLYKRLLGFDVDGIGGKSWEEEHGRYCLPPILFHQIKDMEDPEIEVQEEPTART